MATENSRNEAVKPSPPSQTRRRPSSWAWLAVGRVLDFLASPRLTVVLVLAAIGIVMVGTLAQVQMDIWEVVNDYFRAWVCWVELKLLFPVSLFPWAASTDWESLAVRRFPYPGGALIGLALVVNLVAVFVARFQVKARGARLAWGLLVLAAGVATTWLVIESGHNRYGVQGKPLARVVHALAADPSRPRRTLAGLPLRFGARDSLFWSPANRCLGSCWALGRWL